MFPKAIPAALFAVMSWSASAHHPFASESEIGSAFVPITSPDLQVTPAAFMNVTVLADVGLASAPCSLKIGTRFDRDNAQAPRAADWINASWSMPGYQGRMDPLDFATAPLAPTPGPLALGRPTEPRNNSGRLNFTCETRRSLADERVVTLARGGARNCYYTELPQLRLDDSGSDRGFPPRIILTVRSRENPHAELELMITRSPDGTGWSEPGVAFVLAAPNLRALGVAEARIDLDRTAVASDLAIVMFGETRLRIMMDPSRNALTGKSSGKFFSRLVQSDRATLRLFDKTDTPITDLRFDVGQVLEAAREMLDRTNWSCGKVDPPRQFAMR